MIFLKGLNGLNIDLNGLLFNLCKGLNFAPLAALEMTGAQISTLTFFNATFFFYTPTLHLMSAVPMCELIFLVFLCQSAVHHALQYVQLC